MNTNINKQKIKDPIIGLTLSIIIPSIILIYFKESTFFSPLNLLLVALFFPLSNALYELFNTKKVSLISMLGFCSILFTGIVGLLSLDPKWIAIKEAFIPLTIGAIVLFSALKKKPAIGFLIEQIIDLNKFSKFQEDPLTKSKFSTIYINTTYIISASFLLSAILNFILAKIIVTSPPGSSEFNHQLGVLTAMSYPVIVIPSMIVLSIAFFYLFKQIKQISGMEFSEILKKDFN